MLRRIRERSGTAGFAVGVAALVLALGGGAYAAAKLNSGQKKEVEKIAKKFAGKPGVNGPQGPQGPAGPAGPAGKDGANGAEGKQGPQGKEGTAGKSVKVSEIDPGLSGCKELGGAEVKEEGSSAGVEVCNGPEGTQGPEGKPWTPNNVLPAGAAETGAWFFQAEAGQAFAPVSLPIELPGKLEWQGLGSSENQVHFESESNFGDFDETGTETLGCTGNSQLPLAPPGHLCVYVTEGLENATFEAATTPGRNPAGFFRAGGLLEFNLTAGGAGGGTFAAKARCGSNEVIVEVPEDSSVTGFPEFICEKSA